MKSEPGAVGLWHEWIHRNRFCVEGYFNYICQHLSTRFSQQHTIEINVDLERHKSCMNSNVTVQAEAPLQNNQTCIWFRTTYESGQNQNWEDQILCDICCSHIVMEKTDWSHIVRAKNSHSGHFCLQSEHAVAYLFKMYSNRNIVSLWWASLVLVSQLSVLMLI